MEMISSGQEDFILEVEMVDQEVFQVDERLENQKDFMEL